MAIQIVEAVQQKLGLPELVKVTPDTGVTPQQTLPRPGMHQAVLVTVAAAMYKLTRTNEGTVRLLLSGKNASWLEQPEALGSAIPEVAERLRGYGGDTDGVEALMRKAADAFMLVLHEELKADINPARVKEFMSAQRHNILIYVPADLKLGEMLDDSTWDDQTNHMEGPVSNFLHKIEDRMS